MVGLEFPGRSFDQGSFLDPLIVVDNEAQVIRITGQPEVEETEETLFSEAISPDAMGVQEALGSDE